jgi:hypothetical protein
MERTEDEDWNDGDGLRSPDAPFGCIVLHSARGLDVQLAYGERRDGTIAHISEVPSGLSCDCCCPGCKSQLVARKGAEKVHHFAHHGAIPCHHARESALHKLAKEVLNDRRELLVPAVGAWIGHDALITHEERVHRFDDAVLEHHLDTIVPDVIVRKGKHPLLVEMFVTHRCDLEKVKRVEALGIACVEVDLRSLQRNATREQVAQALTASADRWWVFNPKLDEAATLLEARILAKQETARIDAERKRTREDARIAALEKKILTARRLARPSDARTPAIESAVGMGFDDLVGFSIPGDYCFGASGEFWQAEIVANFVIPLLERGDGYGFNTIAVLKHLINRNAFRPGYPTYFDPAAERALKERIPEFHSPYRIVHAYLRFLTDEYILSQLGKTWSVGHNGHRKWSEHRERERRKAEMLAQARTSVARMLKALPEHERDGFEVSEWLNGIDPELGVSFAEAIAGGGNAAVQLNFKLYQLEAMMLRDGDIVDDLMGLPLVAERQRAIARKRDKEEKARLAVIEQARKAQEYRVDALKAAAAQALQGGATAWLDTPHPKLGAAPRQLALTDSDGLEQALASLTIDGKTRLQQLERERLRARLLALAAQMRKKDHAHLFLNSPNRLWDNQKPIQCCIDDRTFDEVKRAMILAAS